MNFSKNMERELLDVPLPLNENIQKTIQMNRVTQTLEKNFKREMLVEKNLDGEPNGYSLDWTQRFKAHQNAEYLDQDKVFGFTAEGGWRLVITYMRRYEVFGVILKSDKYENAKDLWIDMDEIKNRFMSKSDYGQLNFLESSYPAIIE